jgi:hypothetical protein
MNDTQDHPLRLGNYYRINVKKKGLLTLKPEHLIETFAHTERVRFIKKLPDYDGVPQGKFELTNGKHIILSSWDVTFTWCSDEVCSISGGRTRRKRRRRRSRRFV